MRESAAIMASVLSPARCGPQPWRCGDTHEGDRAIKANDSTGKRIGIRQLADQLGLSVCTVSRILNDKLENASYRPETMERVRAAAAKAGYVPNPIARALVEGSTRTVGLCVADIANPFFGELAGRVESLVARDDYGCLICNTGEDARLEARHLRLLIARRIRALIISPVDPANAGLLQDAVKAGIRVVIVDRDIRGGSFSHVQVNNREAMCELAGRCLDQGHERVGVLAGRRDDPSCELRLQGIRDALRARRLDPDGALIEARYSHGTTTVAGERGMQELLMAEQPPSLVLALANALSVGALQACRKTGVKLGRDVAFAGFDEFESATLVEPAITVVAQPIAEIAAACAEAALDTEGRPINQTFTCTIRWRDSVPRCHWY